MGASDKGICSDDDFEANHGSSFASADFSRSRRSSNGVTILLNRPTDHGDNCSRRVVRKINCP
jgi:hypothetical protein